MKEKNYRGAAVHRETLETSVSISNPSKHHHFEINPKFEIRSFQVCEELHNGKYICEYVTVFNNLCVPIEGNPLDQSNIEMVQYLYELEHGKSSISILSAEDSEEESSQEQS